MNIITVEDCIMPKEEDLEAVLCACGHWFYFGGIEMREKSRYHRGEEHKVVAFAKIKRTPSLGGTRSWKQRNEVEA